MDKLNMPLKMVLTGPESSGKTTLANRLASALETNLTPEFSRPYLEGLGRKYRYNDLKAIASGQKIWEDWHERNCRKAVFICDTDWTVIRIWEQYRFGTTKFTEDEKLSPNAYYFLCAPDMPWEPDVLREHPAKRQTLFALYLQLLTEIQAPFTVLSGDVPQRLETALAIIRKLC